MPLKGIPQSITPELLYQLAKMGHGDSIVIADANFPSDSIASHCIVKTPLRVSGFTSGILNDILKLINVDTYSPFGIFVMDRVQGDKDKNLSVPAYHAIAAVTETDVTYGLTYVERFNFYERAKGAFCVVQTDDITLYANVIVHKGVVS